MFKKYYSVHEQIKFYLSLFFASSIILELVFTQINLKFIQSLAFYLLILQLTISIIIIMLFIYKYKPQKFGLNTSFKLYNIIKKLNRELVNAHIYFGTHSNTVKTPQIKFILDNNNLIIIIKNSIKFHEKLDKLDISSALSDFIVERQYLSNDRNSYIFETYLVNTKTLIFNKLENYLNWCKETSNRYEIRLDERTTVLLHHLGLAAQTGGGKSFALQMLFYQLQNKEHKFYISDSKRADLYYLAKRHLEETYYADLYTTSELINRFYNDMIERQKELEKFFINNPNRDYRHANLPALILCIDEYASYAEYCKLLNKKERDRVEMQLSSIAFLGRQLGCFLWITSQQINAKTLKTSISEQLVLKIVLAESDEQTYRTLFSSSVSIPKVKFKPGQGVFSYPSIASIDKPRFITLPHCKFLEDTVSIIQD